MLRQKKNKNKPTWSSILKENIPQMSMKNSFRWTKVERENLLQVKGIHQAKENWLQLKHRTREINRKEWKGKYVGKYKLILIFK